MVAHIFINLCLWATLGFSLYAIIKTVREA
jgi:hypothetical protein